MTPYDFRTGIHARSGYDPQTKRVFVAHARIWLDEDGELWDPIHDRCVTEEDPIHE